MLSLAWPPLNWNIRISWFCRSSWPSASSQDTGLADVGLASPHVHMSQSLVMIMSVSPTGSFPWTPWHMQDARRSLRPPRESCLCRQIKISHIFLWDLKIGWFCMETVSHMHHHQLYLIKYHIITFCLWVEVALRFFLFLPGGFKCWWERGIDPQCWRAQVGFEVR